jgi:hypothetical protein
MKFSLQNVDFITINKITYFFLPLTSLPVAQIQNFIEYKNNLLCFAVLIGEVFQVI